MQGTLGPLELEYMLIGDRRIGFTTTAWKVALGPVTSPANEIDAQDRAT